MAPILWIGLGTDRGHALQEEEQAILSLVIKSKCDAGHVLAIFLPQPGCFVSRHSSAPPPQIASGPGPDVARLPRGA
jgi:hypothetical protein